MTDPEREMLEMAAKAAGYFYQWNDKFECLEVWNQGERTTRFWQPHRDDGDALRLAVKLSIVVAPYVSYAMADSQHEDAKGDIAAATRRAIVRAAAEIGRTQEPTHDR